MRMCAWRSDCDCVFMCADAGLSRSQVLKRHAAVPVQPCLVVPSEGRAKGGLQDERDRAEKVSDLETRSIPTCACCSSGSSRTPLDEDKSGLHRGEGGQPRRQVLRVWRPNRRHNGVVDNDAQRDGHGRRREDLEGGIRRLHEQEPGGQRRRRAEPQGRSRRKAQPEGGARQRIMLRSQGGGSRQECRRRGPSRSRTTATRRASTRSSKSVAASSTRPSRLLSGVDGERADKLRSATTDEERRALAFAAPAGPREGRAGRLLLGGGGEAARDEQSRRRHAAVDRVCVARVGDVGPSGPARRQPPPPRRRDQEGADDAREDGKSGLGAKAAALLLGGILDFCSLFQRDPTLFEASETPEAKEEGEERDAFIAALKAKTASTAARPTTTAGARRRVAPSKPPSTIWRCGTRTPGRRSSCSPRRRRARARCLTNLGAGRRSKAASRCSSSRTLVG